MPQYRALVRLPNGLTTRITLEAENDLIAKQIGEAQFGVGNVLNWTRVSQ